MPFNYPENSNAREKDKFKERELEKHPEKLYYDTNCRCKKTNLIFKNSYENGWMKAIKEKYSDVEETEQKWIKLKYTNGTICVYESGKVVVYGKLMANFERDFEEIKATALAEKVANMNFQEKNGAGEGKGEGEPTPPEPEE